MPRIFINYRREDSIAYAGRIYDRLVSQFGVANVFMDIDTLAPGADFVEVLQQRVEASDVFLVVIGKNWLAAKDDQGRSRLSNPKDFVALEIAAALGRQAVRTIPVLVGGASIPRATDLPKKLSALTRRQALLLPDIGFQAGIGQLIESIELDERERIERQKAESAQRAERERIERQRAGAERKSREAEEARQKAGAERAARERAEREPAEGKQKRTLRFYVFGSLVVLGVVRILWSLGSIRGLVPDVVDRDIASSLIGAVILFFLFLWFIYRWLSR